MQSSLCLCDQSPQIAPHITLAFSFRKEVGAFFVELNPNLAAISARYATVCSWWRYDNGLLRGLAPLERAWL
jgi:hypothetical protein